MTEDGRPTYSKKYLDYLEDHITCHDLIMKTHKISEKLAGEADLTEYIRWQLNIINTIWIQGMLTVEWWCQKLHTHPYRWTPSITQIIQSIK